MGIKKYIKKLAPKLLLDYYYWLWAFLGALFFLFPSRKLTVIGVTGTSGKSTTVDFIDRIFEAHGDKVASLSSVRFKIGSHEWKNRLKMTMPGRFTIQKFLWQAVKEGCRYAVLEVTSEGIRQFRHKFIRFDVAVFTNLSPEHIESHGGFENYRNEKIKLFKAAKNVHVVNNDDAHQKYFLDVPARKTITFGLKNGDVNMENSLLQLHVMGDFNYYNALAAIAVAGHYGIPLEVSRNALEKVARVPGRMEVVSHDPLVVVDYAHTPEQLESVYKSLRGKPLICVLGSCGGGRDTWKRPVLGEIAARYCREIIITNEDPYDEDPRQILSEITSGISKSQIPVSSFREILDRKEAIKKAIELAKPTDAVVITGKGSEPWLMLANGEKLPWDDRQIAREFLAKNIN